MPKIINNGAVTEDSWQIIARDFEGQLPAGDLLLPLQYWLDNRETLSGHTGGNIGIWIDSTESVEAVGENASNFPVIGVNFPAFADGRGFSIGRLLRERYSYKGQLRAIGNAIRDQLFYLKRCGFDAFDLKDGSDLESALSSLSDFSVTYQTSVEQPEPLFRRY